MNWNRPAMNIIAQESLATVTAPVVQSAPAPVETNTYSAPSTYTRPTLGMSSFRSHVSYGSEYRMNLHASDATPRSDDILALRHQNMGNSYDSFLKQARTNRWKRAMDVTMNMKPIGGVKNNEYLQDLS